VAPEAEPLKVYWQPGCSSCLRAKEFLNRHNVSFVSINVRDDEAGFRELATLGLRRVPIVRRGDAWVDGQVLADVARIAGIPWGHHEPLPPDVLAARIAIVLDVALALLQQVPEDALDRKFAQRPYTYREHAAHIFRIVEAFLDLVETGKRLEFEAYSNVLPPDLRTTPALESFATRIIRRFDAWRSGAGLRTDYAIAADVYYGEQTLHEFLERTTWHSAQHTRQLQLVVETLGLAPARALSAGDLAGLPIPTNVWDDRLAFA
jgi:glutaredoxin